MVTTATASVSQLSGQSSRNPLRLSSSSVDALQNYLRNILTMHNQFTDMRNKMEIIDTAYYRYNALSDTSKLVDGVDIRAAQNSANVSCGIDTDRAIVVPVVISQVDSYVGYLSEVFLSGYPMFPVVSTPSNIKEAETLEAIIDDHATLSAYPREFLMAFRDGIKYNFMPLELSWEPIDQYSLSDNYLTPTASTKAEKTTSNYNRITRLDPYNTVWDIRKSPSRVAAQGEFAGWIDPINRIELKKFINMYSQSGDIYNVGKIDTNQTNMFMYYRDLPVITDKLSSNKKTTIQFDWATWLGAALPVSKKSLMAGTYERFTCYARIIPSEFGINVPSPNTPQIWKFVMLSGQWLLYAKRLITAFDYLPIHIGQPLEDGFELQTPSIGESQVEFQEAASTLMNIRFSSARRSVSDRALYDSSLINEADVNSPTSAPKIPVRLTGLNDKKLTDAYYPIPYDPRGTDGVIGDTARIWEMSDQSLGMNKPARGQFQKGNKSVEEWRDTTGNADNRMRIPALMIEYQVMVPFKTQIKFNIFQFGVEGAFSNQRTGETVDVDRTVIDSLRKKVLSFRVADGYTPKSKLASTDFIVQLMQLVGQSQILQEKYGPYLPRMVAHLAQLGGVRGLDQYSPEVQPQQQSQPGVTSGQPTTAATGGAPIPPNTGAAPPVGGTPGYAPPPATAH